MHLGIQLVVLIQVGNQKIAADRVGSSDAKLPAAKAAGFHQIDLSLTDQLNGRFDVAKKSFSFGRQLDTFCTADKQRCSQLFFQGLDRLADSRLGDIQLAGGLGKA